ncbi:thiamine-phosphate synthase family protein [Thermofilum pendens]|uniref:Conserved hypothetical phosphomethylpyrimidine kinase n=1 Tax=Thermofilum pendens (strain DSM 2475 / Hrk 5) TaxID=368408 RepID=A1RW99_THEPD|nr:thiamine-phosphate synthase family protein [Thermofilum pendens]ABL77479.1 conserved hypothetical phosphomethylpyrimidine kinase [Thermofilum pendens Hrk 5]
MFPETVASSVFVPYLRRVLVSELRKLNMSQTDIARLTGVTQAAVSKILREKQGSRYGSTGLDVPENEIRVVARKIAKILSQGNINEAGFLSNRYWWLIAASGDACKAHEKYGWRKSECYICTKVVYPNLDVSRGLVMADMERALIVLWSSEYFGLLIPEVLTNIAMAIPGAKSIYDVAAVPGRISRSKSGEILYRQPEFGASRHLSGILLSINGKYRAVINIKYDEIVEEALVSMGLRFKEFSSEDYPSANPAASAAAELLEECPDCKALVDVGGENVESVTYIFGNRAVEVANIAVSLSEIYYAVAVKKGKIIYSIETL